jgi:hypothetical protein
MVDERVKCQRDNSMAQPYELWIADVRSALESINMPMDQWQSRWRFDFQQEYSLGSEASMAANKANRFWWHEQNKALRQHCAKTSNCWLPSGHSGECQPVAQEKPKE